MSESGKKERKERKTFKGVVIIDTANEGLAIGRCTDGQIIQVRHAVPGDTVDVVAMEKRKGMYITKPIAHKVYSPYRVEPFCRHFGICGGCKWQHMSYEAQLQFKVKTVHDAYKRIGEQDIARIRPIIGAAEQRYYRNKMEYTASDSRWLSEEEMKDKENIPDKNAIGFHLPGAFDKLLDITHCHLQADPSNAIRLLVKKIAEEQHWPFLNPRTKTGFLRNLIIRNNLAGDVMLVIVVGDDQPDWISLLVDKLTTTFPAIKSIFSCVNTKVNDTISELPVIHEYGARSIIETLGHVRFHIGPKSFFQTNSRQAANLYDQAKQIAGLQPTDNVYDLYCGVGSLGIYMADCCRQVVGIEVISEAIDDARENARLNGISNVYFETGKVELMLERAFVRQYGRPDVVITDPPRAGMHPDVIRNLLGAAPQKIVYVSCNPATQARDIKMLGEVYELISAVPVDMFPHTHHIECIALLQRK